MKQESDFCEKKYKWFIRLSIKSAEKTVNDEAAINNIGIKKLDYICDQTRRLFNVKCHFCWI